MYIYMYIYLHKETYIHIHIFICIMCIFSTLIPHITVNTQKYRNLNTSSMHLETYPLMEGSKVDTKETHSQKYDHKKIRRSQQNVNVP